MSMTGVRNVVAAPARTARRYGLFSVLDFGADERGGILLAWDSIGCGPVQVARDGCLIVSGAPHSKEGTVGCGSDGLADAFTVMAFDDTSLGRDRDEHGAERASAKLLLSEEAAVELEVSTLLAAAATSVTPTVGPGASEPYTVRALASLGAVEQALAEDGTEGVIYVNRALIPLLSDALTVTGSMLRTRLGVPVAGFGGWGPTDWSIIGVAAHMGVRSVVQTGEAADRDTNDNASFAERDYSLGWECTPVIAVPGDIA